MYEIHEFVRNKSPIKKFSRKLTAHESFIEAIDRLALLDHVSYRLKYSYEIYDRESNRYMHKEHPVLDKAQNSMVQRGYY